MRKTILLLTLLFFSSAHSGLKTPSDFFGFQPGADRMLFDYEKLIAYLQLLDESSAQLKLVNIGESPMGRPMYMALISSVKVGPPLLSQKASQSVHPSSSSIVPVATWDRNSKKRLCNAGQYSFSEGAGRFFSVNLRYSAERRSL